MDILNIISWLRSSRRVTTIAEPGKTLIPIGVKNNTRDDKYAVGAITVEDFVNGISAVESVTGLNTNNADPLNPIIAISVDGTSITGAGTPASPLVAVSSGGGTSTYSNVVFVDLINGNNTTGLINRFDKPFLTIAAARTAAAALSGITVDNRALVYIRRGQYNNPTLTLTNNVDFYCEPGVVFTGAVSVTDGGLSVSSNVYGSLKIYAWTTTSPPVSISGGSTVTFEFDYISSQAAALQIFPTSSVNRVTIKGNYIYSGTIGQQFGITIRNAANVVMNIANAIEAPHAVFRFRNFTGTAVINCPRINLVLGNVYGGNFKMCLYLSDSISTGNITVNGDLIVTDTVNYGGVGAAVAFWDGAPNYKLKINGNVSGGPIKAFNCPVGSSATVQVNGNVTSQQEVIWAYGSGKFIFKNSIITCPNAAHTGSIIAVNGTAEVYFKDCYLFNAVVDQALIQLNSLTVKLILDGCQGVASGSTAGTLSITTTVGGGLLYVNNSRFNKIINASLSDTYSPTGLIIDANTQAINIF
jgi:hypothetical protein